MARGYINQEQARVCLEEATQSRDSLLNVALRKNWISGAQIQEILNLSRTGALQTQMATPSTAPSHETTAPQQSSEAPQVGQTLGAYRLTRVLGRGAMGIVYGAELKGIEYALKLVLQESDPEAIQRFEIEAQALAAVDRHPNIVRIHKYERTGLHRYFILDLIDGESLDRRLLSGAFTKLHDCVTIARKMASALAHIHKHNIVHRDLKSANILLRHEDGEAFLSDFGLVKRLDFATMTKEGESLGTPQTMSPEQIQGEPLDARSDIWSLGVVLYEMSTGRLPFQSEKLVELGQKIVEQEPDLPQSINPNIPDDLQSIILKCLAKDPEQRYPDAKRLERDCQAFLNGQPLSIAGAKKTSSKTKSLLKILVLLVFILLPLGIYLALDFQKEENWKGATSLSLLELKKFTDEIETRELEVYGAYLFNQSKLQFPQSIDWKKIVEDNEALLEPLQNFDKNMAMAAELGLEKSKKAVLKKESYRRSIRVAVCSRALENLRASNGQKLSSAQQKAIPKPFRVVSSAYQAMLLKKWDEARTHFEKATMKDQDIAQLGRLGLALIEFQQEKWTALRFACDPLLEKNSKLSPFAAILRERATKEEFLALLTKKNSRPSQLFKSAALWRGQSSIKEDEVFWSGFQSELQSRFKSQAKTERARLQLLVIYKNLKALRKLNSQLRLPKLDRATHLSAASQALRAEDRAQAYYHYLQVRSLDPSFQLPVGFRIEDIPKVMTLAFAERNSKKSLKLWFKMVLAASRAGLFVPVVSDEWIIRLYKDGVLDREVSENSDDPAARYWRGLAWTCANSLPDREKAQALLKKCFNDFSFAIDSKKMSDTFTAMALTERVNCRNQMSNYSETIGDSLADLRRATKMPHPCPDQIYALLFDIQMTQLGLEDSLKLLEQSDRAIQDRLKRTQDHALTRDRPKDSPMMLLNDVDRASTCAANHRRRAELYLLHRKYKEGEQEALLGLKLKTTDALLCTLGRAYLYQSRIADAEAILRKHPASPARPLLLQLQQNVNAIRKAMKGQ